MANFEVGDIVSIIYPATGEVVVRGCRVEATRTAESQNFVQVFRPDWGVGNNTYPESWCRLEQKAPPPGMDKMLDALTRLHEDQEDLKNLLLEIYSTLRETKLVTTSELRSLRQEMSK